MESSLVKKKKKPNQTKYTTKQASLTVWIKEIKVLSSSWE